MKRNHHSRSKSFVYRAARSRNVRHSERGVALVITLLLLAVITFMAITFLVVSRSEKGAVTTQTDQAFARLAADTGFERAKAEALASIIAYTNPFSSDLVVSTNYIRVGGFINGNSNPTNVSYEDTSGKPLTGNDALQNLANLYYNPRPPVFMTNRVQRSNEFRFYYDINRNGRFDRAGPAPVLDNNGKPVTVTVNGNTTILSNYFVGGDPEAIGLLERPEFPHSASNRFTARYWYVVVPANKTLDINYIHNQARNPNKTGFDQFGRDFLRNQGVGTWELNLASFLYDLNTNYWGGRYFYDPTKNFDPDGNAFVDAFSIFTNRCAARPLTLEPVSVLFGVRGQQAFSRDHFDGYTAGPLMITNFSLLPNQNSDPDNTRTTLPWPGADNTNHFFSLSDFYDSAKTSISFTQRLVNAGNQLDSYNSRTFYRLLSQMGTDSAPEQNKINLNYQNVNAAGTVVPNMATNFVEWTNAVQFFTNAANRLLANDGYNFTVDRIQLWPTNYYTPSVHRLLQLAANMYDATTVRRRSLGNSGIQTSTNFLELPTVFRPMFAPPSQTNNFCVYITGYEEVTDGRTIADPLRGVILRDLTISDSRNNIKARDMVYGVPLIVGAKKGLPNFNEFAMQTLVQVTRKLQFLRRNANDHLPFLTNQMYVIAVSNIFGVEAWNSYSNSFPSGLLLQVKTDFTAQLTNEVGIKFMLPAAVGFYTNFSMVTNIAAGNWSGFLDPNHASASFEIPLAAAFMPMTNSVYLHNQRRFVPVGSPFDRFESPSLFPVPHWWLNLKTRLVFTLLDPTSNRILDYANLNSSEDPLDITDTLMQGGQCGETYTPDGSDGSMWCTNRYRGFTPDRPTYGVLNQIAVGLGLVQPLDWNSFVQQSPPGQDRRAAIDFFRTQFGLSPITYPSDSFFRSNTFYAPFAPIRNIYLFTSFQANDPLVHYTIGDLMDPERTNRIGFTTNFSTIANLGRINRRYEPWGGNPSALSSSPTRYELAVKDPLVNRSDDWDFPTNKFPNVGWLGRVHRGTPWQTIYLKAPVAPAQTWHKWTGGGYKVRNLGQISTNVVALNALIFDADLNQPWRDRYLLDLFTASVNDNASRGQMSINQTNLAAWSAVLAGVVTLTNTVSDQDFTAYPLRPPHYAAAIIPPAGPFNPFTTNANQLPPLVRIVNAINNVRATNAFTQPRKVFSRLGDILAVPELTVASPFLNTNTANLQIHGISDAAYERIPQQILGLLRADPAPRFVIYSYGQALKPADRSLVTSGRFFGLCTNYQITAEVATRAVVRIDGIPTFPPPPVPAPALTNVQVVVESFNVLPPE